MEVIELELTRETTIQDIKSWVWSLEPTMGDVASSKLALKIWSWAVN